jgi:hypothetical protein
MAFFENLFNHNTESDYDWFHGTTTGRLDYLTNSGMQQFRAGLESWKTNLMEAEAKGAQPYVPPPPPTPTEDKLTNGLLEGLRNSSINNDGVYWSEFESALRASGEWTRAEIAHIKQIFDQHKGVRHDDYDWSGYAAQGGSSNAPEEYLDDVGMWEVIKQMYQWRANLGGDPVPPLPPRPTPPPRETPVVDAYVDAVDNGGAYDWMDGDDDSSDGHDYFPLCWVAREVYGEHNLKWLAFREWVLEEAPAWFRELYRAKGANVASFIRNKPRVKAILKLWMNTRIAPNVQLDSPHFRDMMAAYQKAKPRELDK